MPSCAALGCTSRFEKGRLLKVFPRKDKHRRQIWIDRINRPGWTPSKYSALCELHFDRDQWEVPREDGKRKLKSTAVPTIFCVNHPSSDDTISLDHAYCYVGYRQLFSSANSCEDHQGEDDEAPQHLKVEERERVVPAADDSSTCPEDAESSQGELGDHWSGEQVWVKQELCEDENVCDNSCGTVGEDGVSDPREDSCRLVEGGRHNTSDPSENDYETVEGDRHNTCDPSESDCEAVEEDSVCDLWLRESRCEDNVEEAETIQCTPDIALYPDEEPDPIEEVECEIEDVNAFTCDPSIDPLAPSPDDVVQVDQVVPSFGKSKKLMFVQKHNKLVLPQMPRVVEGEPLLPEIPANLQSKRIILPKPPPLLNPTRLKGPPVLVRVANLSPPKLTPMPRPRPVLYLRTSPEKLSLLKLKQQSTTTGQVIRPRHESGVLPLETSLQPAPEYLRPGIGKPPSPAKAKSRKVVTVVYPQPGFIPLSKTIFVKKNKKLFLSPQKVIFPKPKNLNNTLVTKNGETLEFSSVQNCAKTENIFLEHQYTNRLGWKPFTMDGVKFDSSAPGKNVLKLVGNKWKFNNQLSAAKSGKEMKTEETEKKKPLSSILPKLNLSSTNPSSVLIVKPLNGSKSTSVLNKKSLIQPQSKKVDLYQCPTCKYLFLTLTSLKIHRKTHFGRRNVSCLKTTSDENLTKAEVQQSNEGLTTNSSSQKEKKPGKETKLKSNNQIKKKQTKRRRKEILLNLKKTSKDEEFIRLSKLVSTVQEDIPHEMSHKQTEVSEERERSLDEMSTDSADSVYTSNRKEGGGLVVDASGRKYSLRAKVKTYKSKLLAASRKKSGKRKSKVCDVSKKIRDVSKKIPVVLIPKLDVDIELYRNKQHGKKSFDSSREKDFDVLSHPDGLPLDSVKKDKEDSVVSKSSQNNLSGEKMLSKGEEEDSVEDKTQQKEMIYDSLNVKCPSCDLIIQRKSLKIHLQLHNRCEYTCELCGKKFSKSFHLRRHTTLDHKSSRKLQCLRKGCSRMFETKRELDKHTRFHTRVHKK